MHADPLELIGQSQQLPAAQRNRYVSIAPQVVMDGPQRRVPAAQSGGVGDQRQNLRLADLVRDRLPWTRGERCGLFVRRLEVHGYLGGQISGGGVDGEG